MTAVISYRERHNREVWRKRILSLAVGITLLAAGGFLLYRYLQNERFIRDYRRGIYEDAIEKELLNFNIPESYVPLYNLGNLAFRDGDYAAAENYYIQALDAHPRHLTGDDASCDVRVNLALSICYQIDFERIASEADAAEAIERLREARGYLTEDGCANPEAGVYDGHNAEAEQLKAEIDAMIEMLENPPPSGGGGEEGGGEDSGEGDSSPDASDSPQAQELMESIQNAREQMQSAEQEGSGSDGGGNPPPSGNYW